MICGFCGAFSYGNLYWASFILLLHLFWCYLFIVYVRKTFYSICSPCHELQVFLISIIYVKKRTWQGWDVFVIYQYPCQQCRLGRLVWRFRSLYYSLLPLIRKWYILSRIWWRGKSWRERPKRSWATRSSFNAPHEEVRSVELVAKPDAFKRPIVVSRIGYERMSAR